MLRNCSFSRLSPISSLHRSIDSIFSFFSLGSNTKAVASGSTVTIHWLLSSHFSNSSRDKVDYEEEGLIINRDPKTPPKLFVIQPRLRPDSVLNAKLAEALNLANSLEEQRNFIFDSESEEKELPDHIVVQNPVARSLKGHSDTYFGQGTVDTIKCHLNALESKEAVDAIFVNSILSGIQQRNLEREWGKPVLDRVGLIIEIFNAHAQTKEAKLQSELAALMYKRTRLVRVRGSDGRYAFGVGGEAEVVSARGRGSGGRGVISGAGETELQLQRRRILERRSYLLSQIEEVRRTRALQRASRRRHGGPNGQGLDTVAVVGYTNAGKSTLVSALSNTDLYRDDRLFATVDPRLRSVFLPSGRKILLSDTVGFISDLPVQLVEAFHATLEEVVEADLLVHVLDASAPNMEEQRSAVLEVLHQIGVPEEKFRTMIEVRNKIDLCEKNSATKAQELVRNNEGSSISEEEAMGSELLPKEQNGINSEAFSEELVRDDGVISTEALSNVDEFNGENVHPNCDLQCIETSAITGSGLQELLKLIDDKLNTARLVERISFDRKWRPPHTTHADTAVE